MPLYLNNEQSLLFLHIPKTGGTTVESWLSSTNNYQELFLAKNRLPDSKVTPQHFGYDTLKSLIGNINEQNIFKFAIVRNPYQRLVSEFFYRIKLRELNLGKNPEVYFSAWICDVLSQVKQCPELLDNHLQPQSYYCADDVSIYKFEDGINNIIIEIAKTLDLTQPNNIKPKKVGVKGNVLWSQQAISMVNAFYQDDFKKFNYELFSQQPSNIISRIAFKHNALRYMIKKSIESLKNTIRYIFKL